MFLFYLSHLRILKAMRKEVDTGIIKRKDFLAQRRQLANLRSYERSPLFDELATAVDRGRFEDCERSVPQANNLVTVEATIIMTQEKKRKIKEELDRFLPCQPSSLNPAAYFNL